MSAAAPVWMRAVWTRGAANAGVVAEEPWGRLERVAEGVWALTSTPLTGDRTTLCNGGIIAGRHGVMMVEAFASDAGARWMASQALALTGRAPSHVLLTHYHGDHAGGIRGAIQPATAAGTGTPPLTAKPTPQLYAAEVTRELVRTRNTCAPLDLLAEATLLSATDATRIDLGGRSVAVHPLTGHTSSDVAVHVEDEQIVFCGDLVWNGMFPNYVDAVPSALTQSVKGLRALHGRTYVPGHGTLADANAIDRYLALLDSVEEAARRAVDQGISAEAAGAAYRLPSALGEWHLFNARYYERAIGAWMKELGR